VLPLVEEEIECFDAAADQMLVTRLLLNDQFKGVRRRQRMAIPTELQFGRRKFQTII
jgi:hypothetical protein